MTALQIEPISKPFEMTFAPPGSKSLTNRAMVLAALSDGPCKLTGALFADDTRVMIEGLRALGFEVRADEAKCEIEIVGQGGRISPPLEGGTPLPLREGLGGGVARQYRGPGEIQDSPHPTLPLKGGGNPPPYPPPQGGRDTIFCGNSGTTIRFLTAVCSLGSGTYTLDGIPRMRERPIGPLVTMLRNLGVRIEHTMKDGFPPVRVQGHGLPGGMVKYGSETSSQYLSAVLQVAPYAKHEVRVDLVGRQTSWPYVAMTMRLMDQFGHLCELERHPDTGEPTRIIVPHGVYALDHYPVEPDASNATYSLALAAIHPKSKITIERLGKRSLQGDVGFADVLHQMGASLTFGPDFITIIGPEKLEGIDVDLSNMPDTAQTLAVVALFAEGPTTIRGLHTLRVKETDRLAALENELTKLGAEVEIEGDTLHIHPPEKLKPAAIDTYDDHRMAMSFALAGTKSSGIRINDPACVNKTYPGYFADLERFRA